ECGFMKLKILKIIALLVCVSFLFTVSTFADAQKAKQYLDAGVKYVKAKDYDKAIQYLNYSIKMQPTSNAYYYLGYAYYAKGDKNNALSNFQMALKLNPSNTAAKQMVDKLGASAEADAGAGDPKAQQYLIAGHKYLKAKDYDNAIKYYQASINIQPTYQAYQFMGTAYYYKGDKAKAKEAYEKSLELNPNNPGVRNILAKLGGVPPTTTAEPRLSEQIGVHPLILAGAFAGALAVIFLF
ncbi:MAG: tetratricopeptide repeat protein, partial [Candidatus Goldbacteria bacterium]|nr:tetratricopeptide repeat protein [Candidatus Goldiibacteriota bacterium]